MGSDPILVAIFCIMVIILMKYSYHQITRFLSSKKTITRLHVSLIPQSIYESLSLSYYNIQVSLNSLCASSLTFQTIVTNSYHLIYIIPNSLRVVIILSSYIEPNQCSARGLPVIITSLFNQWNASCLTCILLITKEWNLFC